MVQSLTDKILLRGPASASSQPSAKNDGADGTPSFSKVRSFVTDLKNRVTHKTPQASGQGLSGPTQEQPTFLGLPVEIRQMVLRSAGTRSALNMAKTCKEMHEVARSDPALKQSIAKCFESWRKMQGIPDIWTSRTTSEARMIQDGTMIREAVQVMPDEKVAELCGAVKYRLTEYHSFDQVLAAKVAGILLGSGRLQKKMAKDLASWIDQPKIEKNVDPVAHRSLLMTHALQALADSNPGDDMAFQPLLKKLEPCATPGQRQLLGRNGGYGDLLAQRSFPLANLPESIKGEIQRRLAAPSSSRTAMARP